MTVEKIEKIEQPIPNNKRPTKKIKAGFKITSMPTASDMTAEVFSGDLSKLVPGDLSKNILGKTLRVAYPYMCFDMFGTLKKGFIVNFVGKAFFDVYKSSYREDWYNLTFLKVHAVNLDLVKCYISRWDFKAGR